MDNADSTSRLPVTGSEMISVCQLVVGKVSGRRAAVVIEVAYLDSRDTGQLTRKGHVEDALELRDLLTARSVRCLLNVFNNDLGQESICGVQSCKPGPGNESEGASIRLPTGISNDARVFGMRHTRNRASKALKRALGRGLQDGIGIALDDSPPMNEIAQPIVAHTADGPVHLGMRDRVSGRIIPRCALIMAQHYIDLCSFARSEVPTLDDLVIIDFNHQNERDRVSAGSRATFVLHNWPAGLRVHILNCVYFAEGERQFSLQINDKPD